MYTNFTDDGTSCIIRLVDDIVSDASVCRMFGTELHTVPAV